jgi:exopolyphosphatase/guanosine-5'-triphosphate,3'-diphosphate pyrophosphatase
MQVSHFTERRLLRGVSVPTGSLRLSISFLHSDPPAPAEIRRLRQHVHGALEQARVAPARGGDAVVGTGGTIRNLAKLHRARHPGYPITRLHGYVLSRPAVRELALELARLKRKAREALPGLSAERADSVVGGALAVDALLEWLGAEEVVVSGQGVREGLAYSQFSGSLSSIAAVRKASVASLGTRFGDWQARTAERRAALAGLLLDLLEPRASGELRDALSHAAQILDIGRSVDFFARHQHASDITAAAELDGFTHREIALRAAIVRAAGDEDQGPSPYRPLLGKADREPLERAAVLLALADEIEQRCPPPASIVVDGVIGKQGFVLTVPALAGWRPRGIAGRFARAFGRPLVVRRGA